MPVLHVTRKQVLGYRAAAQQLERHDATVADLAILDLGLQEAMGHPAGYAVTARVAAPHELDIGPGRPFALAWTFRGAPHVHRRADLDKLSGALFPLSEADAAGRLNETGPSVARAGIPALEQFRLAVDAMAQVVDGSGSSLAKGAASTEVSKRLPPAMRRQCRACQTAHISDSAMRIASLPAGLELEPGTNPPVLVRQAVSHRPDRPDRSALGELLLAYLRLLGPARVGEAAGYVEARRADVVDVWAKHVDGRVADVAVDGRPATLPVECVEALRSAPDPEFVRLLGPFDPWLQARDRDLIVPDKAVQKALWPVLGRPGALVVDGEVVGAWRTKTSGKKLTVTVDAFAALPPSVWDAVAAESERIGAVRRAVDVSLVRS